MPYYGKRAVARRYGYRKRRRLSAPVATTMAVTRRAPRGGLSGGMSRVYTFQRTATTSFVITNGADFTQAAYSFTLQSLPNYTEFTALFDQYRINYIDCTVILNRTASSTLPSLNEQNQTPNFHWATDKDDATAIDLNALMQYADYRVQRMDKIIRFRIRPSPCLAAYQGAFTGYTTTARTWIDCGSPGVVHYGLKCGYSMVADVSNVNMGRVNLYFRYNVSFKGCV